MVKILTIIVIICLGLLVTDTITFPALLGGASSNDKKAHKLIMIYGSIRILLYLLIAVMLITYGIHIIA